MNLQLEQKDLEAIAEQVAKRLLPLLARASNPKIRGEDVIFDVVGLAAYLKVKCSWVYKKASDKEIPYFKVGGYTRFRKSDIDKWLENQEVKAIPH